MLTRGHFIGQIVDDLADIAAQAKQRARLHLFDIHAHVENFTKEVLNRALGLGLSNLNAEHPNNPGLDLGDANNGWAFQVTADKSSAKVKETLEKIDEKQRAKYPNIRILVIGEKQGSYTFTGKPFESFDFKPEMVWDFNDVCSRIMSLPIDILEDLAGYVFTENSPSCGLHSVKVHAEDSDDPVPLGRGVYARALSETIPELPVEEAGRLADDAIRESFVDKVFAYAHWSEVRRGGLSAAAVAEFHGCYGYLLMAHSVAHWYSIQHLLRDFEGPPDALGDRYLDLLLAGLGQTATLASHANALLHLTRQLGDALDRTRHDEVGAQIGAFRDGKVAVRDVLRTVREGCATSGRVDLQNQVYLMPPGN